MTINQYGSAFPYEQSGLTKREYAAIEAMKGILAGNEVSIEFAAMTLGIPVDQYNPLVHWVQYIAKRAADHADALLGHLENPITIPTPTEAASPIQPVEGMYQQDETGETYRFTDGEWQLVQTAKGGEGGTADTPPTRGEILFGGVIYSPDHPDYEEMLKKIDCNFPGSCK